MVMVNSATGPGAGGSADRMRTAAAILLPMSIPAALIVALALTLDGGEEALAALAGSAPAPAPQAMTGAPVVAAPLVFGHARQARGPVTRGEARPAVPAAQVTAAPAPDALPLIARAAPPPAPQTRSPRAPDAGMAAVWQAAVFLPPGTAPAPVTAAAPLSPPVADSFSPAPAVFLPAPRQTGAPQTMPAATGRFTTAAEVRPVLESTRASWVAVRDWNGQDLLYFSSLTGWRCGLSEIRFGINGDAPTRILPLEPCHDGTNAPNAMRQDHIYPVYLTFPPGTVQSVTVALTYDDGQTASAAYARHAILMP